MTVRARWEAILNAWYLGVMKGTTNPPVGSWIRKLHPKEWSQLESLGDKMPCQVADPVVFKWLWARMPDSVYVHIHRHPKYAVASMQRLAYNTWWRDPTHEVLHQWAVNEQRALTIAKTAPVFRVSQERLAVEPQAVINELFGWLGLEPSKIKQMHHRSKTEPVKLPYDDLAESIMREYEYV